MTSTSVARVVRSLGLAEMTDATGDGASFPLGVLYPYSRDLQRVCTSYDTVSAACPDAAPILLGEASGRVGPLGPEQATAVGAYLASLAALHGRIAFAPGAVGASVGAAYRRASDALVSATRR
jgi:hypothetical protein